MWVINSLQNEIRNAMFTPESTDTAATAATGYY